MKAETKGERARLPCTTNFSRGDFAATNVAKTEKNKTRRFIFPATAELQDRVFLFLSFLFLTAVEGPSLRCCVPLCAARPGPLAARLRRRHTRSEKSGCQAPPRKQEALGGGW